MARWPGPVLLRLAELNKKQRRVEECREGFCPAGHKTSYLKKKVMWSPYHRENERVFCVVVYCIVLFLCSCIGNIVCKSLLFSTNLVQIFRHRLIDSYPGHSIVSNLRIHPHTFPLLQQQHRRYREQFVLSHLNALV